MGVKLGFMSVPLSKASLKSYMVSAHVTMGIHPDRLVKAVNLLLGNDLAGDNVMMNPSVSSHPCSRNDTDAEIQDTPGCLCGKLYYGKKHLITASNPRNEDPKSNVQSQSSGSTTVEGPLDLTDSLKS